MLTSALILPVRGLDRDYRSRPAGEPVARGLLRLRVERGEHVVALTLATAHLVEEGLELVLLAGEVVVVFTLQGHASTLHEAVTHRMAEQGALGIDALVESR